MSWWFTRLPSWTNESKIECSQILCFKDRWLWIDYRITKYNNSFSVRKDLSARYREKWDVKQAWSFQKQIRLWIIKSYWDWTNEVKMGTFKHSIVNREREMELKRSRL